MVDALRRVAEGQDKDQAKRAQTLLQSGAPITNAAAYKILEPQMLGEAPAKTVVEQPKQTKFFSEAKQPGMIVGALTGQPPTKSAEPAVSNVTKNFTDNSTKTVNVKVDSGRKDEITKLARTVANDGLRGKMDREFDSPFAVET